MLALYQSPHFARLLPESNLSDFGLKFCPPPGVAPRPTVRADQNDPVLTTVAKKGDVKAPLVAAVLTYSELVARLELLYFL